MIRTSGKLQGLDHVEEKEDCLEMFQAAVDVSEEVKDEVGNFLGGERDVHFQMGLKRFCGMVVI